VRKSIIIKNCTWARPPGLKAPPFSLGGFPLCADKKKAEPETPPVCKSWTKGTKEIIVVGADVVGKEIIHISREPDDWCPKYKHIYS
jgi:hypothetical protein